MTAETPAALPPNQTLPRREALEHCSFLDESDLRILKVEAQAGQGKTVLINQFEQQSSRPFVWLSCTEGDSTPQVFCERLVEALGEALPDFSSQGVLATLRQQLVPGTFVETATHRMVAELAQAGVEPTLVLDDVHMLQGAEESKRLLRELTVHAPKGVRFIIISRFPLMQGEGPLIPSNKCLEIDASLLAFNREEIALLYNELLQVPADSAKVNMLLEATEGWVTGLLLLRTARDIRKLTSADEIEALGEFFNEMTSSSLSSDLQREVGLLSLLEEMPEEFLGSHASGTARNWLNEMAARNLFVRARRSGGEITFHFHHLYQQHLRQETRKHCPLQARQEFLCTVGEWHLERGHPGKSAGFFIQAEAWGRVSNVLKDHCFQFVLDNRHQFLVDTISGIPEDVRESMPWLCLAMGTGLLGIAPMHCAPVLKQALDLSQQTDSRMGELGAICCLLRFHYAYGGDIENKEKMLKQATALFRHTHHALPAAMVVLCAQIISEGKTFIECRLDEASEFITMAKKNLPAENSGKLLEMEFTESLMLCLRGDMRKALDAMEPFYALRKAPWISPVYKFSVMVMHLNLLEMQGDHICYQIMREEILRDWQQFIPVTSQGAFITIWGIDILIKEGRYAEAGEIARNSGLSPQFETPHLACQLLHYDALAQALMGREAEVVEIVRKALRFRARAGGSSFIHLTQCLVGAALSLTIRTRTADRIFAKCLKGFDRASIYHAPTIYAYRANMRLRLGQEEGARRDVRRMLESLKHHGNRHFFGWSYEVMNKVLGFAVREDIEAEYARMLVREQMGRDILEDGTIIQPLNINTIDGLALSIGETTLPGSELTPTWQQVLKLLALAPGHSVEIKKLQTELWPDGTSDAIRSKFDTMLSRLRGKLSKVFGKETVRRHLQLKDQRLQLLHCVVDCDIITANADEGLAFVVKGKMWQAHNAFMRMVHWIGPGFPGALTHLSKSDPVAGKISQALTTWSTLLQSGNEPDRSMEMIDAALGMDGVNDTLQRQRYDLLVSLNRPMEASKSLKEYRAVLKSEGFEENEINHFLDNMLGG